MTKQQFDVEMFGVLVINLYQSIDLRRTDAHRIACIPKRCRYSAIRVTRSRLDRVRYACRSEEHQAISCRMKVDASSSMVREERERSTLCA